MLDEKYYIPKHLDDPPRFLLWTMDEAIVLMAPFMLGIIFSHVLLALMVGASLLLGMKKIKGNEGPNFLFNVMYWYLPLRHFKRTPPSFIREFVG